MHNVAAIGAVTVRTSRRIEYRRGPAGRIVGATAGVHVLLFLLLVTVVGPAALLTTHGGCRILPSGAEDAAARYTVIYPPGGMLGRAAGIYVRLLVLLHIGDITAIGRTGRTS